MAAKNKSNEIQHYPRLRCTRRSRVGRLDRSRTSRPVVGTARLHADHAQQGPTESAAHWHYTMHGPDGIDYPNKTLYHEVETHSKLVYDHGGNDDRPPLFRVTVLFSETGGKTKMDMTMTLAHARSGRGNAQVHQEGRRRLDLGPARRVPREGIVRQGAVRHQPHVRRAAGRDVRDVDEPRALFAAGCRRPASRCSSSAPTSGPAAARSMS